MISFWKRLRAAHAKIDAVASDLSPAYLFAVCRNLPKALHVCDHFHVVKLFNDRLAEFRRDSNAKPKGLRIYALNLLKYELLG